MAMRTRLGFAFLAISLFAIACGPAGTIQPTTPPVTLEATVPPAADAPSDSIGTVKGQQGSGSAQNPNAQIQEFFSIVDEDTPFVYFDLFGMTAGETIYLYAGSDSIDPYLTVCDIDCEEIFGENDDIDFDNANYNAALEFVFPADGDYSIAVGDCCNFEDSTPGLFQLQIGYDAPEVLTGNALPTGSVIAVPYAPTYTNVMEDPTVMEEMTDEQIQQFTGSLGGETQILYYDIFDARAGETLYIYAEALQFDTYIGVCDINCEEVFAENDDIDTADGNYNSALEFSFPVDGDYSIFIEDCCSFSASGDFRLLLGYNTPGVLTGKGSPTGAEIAQEYQVGRANQAEVEVERNETASCSDGLFTAPRPSLSGTEQTIETENFIIHYTTTGQDSATPEFVNEVASYIEGSLQAQIDMGWPAPPRDCGEGGDTRFDVYIEEILTSEGILGYANTETIIGDNLNSPAIEQWAATSYLALDNDFSGTPEPLNLMRATIDHELNHNIQFGYDVNDPGDWMYEATATWIETVVNPEYQFATDYVEDVVNAPDLCVGSQNDVTGLRIYGEYLLIDSIAQDFGNDSIISLWEHIADYEDMDAYYQFLTSLGTTPQEVSRRYAIRNLLRDYATGPAFPDTIRIEGSVEGFGDVFPSGDGVQQLGADYVLIRQKGNYTFSINQPNLSLVVVGIDQAAGQATIFDLGVKGTVNTERFDTAYVIVLNNDQHDSIAACTTTNWLLTVADTAGVPETPDNGERFSTINFVPAF